MLDLGLLSCRRINLQIFQTVLNIQNFVMRLPGQIDRQQPVYFTDAFGKVAPFHLEFVTSAEVRGQQPVSL